MPRRKPPDAEPAQPCLCAAVRKAGRALTRIYDAHLRPCGLKVTQFSMLATIARNPGITVSGLGKLLLMDQTTVTRNLGVLAKRGYIGWDHEEQDQRRKLLSISTLGRAKLEEARPYWAQAQRETAQALGHEGVVSLLEAVRLLAG